MYISQFVGRTVEEGDARSTVVEYTCSATMLRDDSSSVENHRLGGVDYYKNFTPFIQHNSKNIRNKVQFYQSVYIYISNMYFLQGRSI